MGERLSEKGRTGYQQFEPDNTNDPITHEQALEGINRIRDSIVGTQTFNWSEHMYPLVSLLDRAGFEGLPYPESRANVGLVLDQLAAAESSARLLADALAPFAEIERQAREESRHQPGSSSLWRIKYDDLMAARSALDAHKEENG